MQKNILHKIQGDRKYFAIVFFILILVLISAILTPRFIEDKKNNWSDELTIQIEQIEQSVNRDFEAAMVSTFEMTKQLKTNLRNVFISGDEAYREIIKTLNQKRFEDYSIGIFAPNGRIDSVE